jgi:hypothetical protein
MLKKSREECTLQELQNLRGFLSSNRAICQHTGPETLMVQFLQRSRAVVDQRLIEVGLPRTGMPPWNDPFGDHSWEMFEALRVWVGERPEFKLENDNGSH